VNRVLPEPLDGEFYRARLAQERLYLDEINRRFARLPRAVVRQLPSDVRGLDDLVEVARQIFG
jgi:arsenite-transporting ATPase